ncbi:MAG: hypothetical protein R2726_17620 [Acidimicrobiales bacterium]
MSRATTTTEDVPAHARRLRPRFPVVALVALTLVLVGYVAIQVIDARVDRSPEAFCRQLPVVANLDRSLGNLDPVGVRQDLPQLERLRDSSPGEIEPSVAVLVQTTSDLLEPLDRAADDGGAALEEAWRARSADAAAIAQAGKAVQDYAKATCGIDLTAPGG